jgi:hypothetical protein
MAIYQVIARMTSLADQAVEADSVEEAVKMAESRPNDFEGDEEPDHELTVIVVNLDTGESVNL